VEVKRMEIYVDFTINNEKYRLVIVKKMFRLKHVGLHKVSGQLLNDVIPIEKVGTSTLKELIEYWFSMLRLKVSKKRRNEKN
jgi:hypothetical protein